MAPVSIWISPKVSATTLEIELFPVDENPSMAITKPLLFIKPKLNFIIS